MTDKTETHMLRGAHVEVKAKEDQRNPVVEIEVNGKFHHTFSASSRVSKALEEMSPMLIEERLNGGNYFFVNGILYDFRDRAYNGFIHTDESIAALKDTIGIRFGVNDRQPNNTQNSRIALNKVWSNQDIHVPGIDEGGVFTSQLKFNWNPFIETINSSFDVVRLICTNGMMGLTSLFNSRIPLINRWEEHLDIADKQIQNKLYSLLGRRFQQMVLERASLADCIRLQKHCQARMDMPGNFGGDRQRLRNIAKAVSPDKHLSKIYKPEAMKDQRLAAQLPAHLSAFDAYNIATELASHTNQVGGSSDHALDRFANMLVFDRASVQQASSRFGDPMLSAFSDPDKAFFGDGED